MTSPLNLHTFATCESGGGSFVLRLGFDSLPRAQTAHQFVVDSARAKSDPVPAWFDLKALEVAKRFTQDTEPQRRASLQVAVVEAMEMAAPPTDGAGKAWPPLGIAWAIDTVRSEFPGDVGARLALDHLEIRIKDVKPRATELDASKAVTPSFAFGNRVVELFKDVHGEAPADTLSAMRYAAAEAFSELTATPTPPAAPALLVRDVADMLGVTVPQVSKAAVDLGGAPLSTNMAVTPEEAVAIAKHIARPAPSRPLFEEARKALAELSERASQVKVALDANIPTWDPVHEQSAALTWPISTAKGAIDALDAWLAATPAAGDESGQITLTAPQLRQALDFVNPDKGDADQQEDRLTIAWAKESTSEGETRPAGLYAWFTEYPEEGAIYLDPEDPAPEAMPFEVRIAGPDDVIPFADELDAHRRANIINQQHVADCLKNPAPEAYVMCVATVHEAKRCTSCDGTGDVVDQIGEWRGVCTCEAGDHLRSQADASKGQGGPV